METRVVRSNQHGLRGEIVVFITMNRSWGAGKASNYFGLGKLFSKGSPGAIRIIDTPITCHKLTCLRMTKDTGRERRRSLIICPGRGIQRHTSSPCTWRLDIPGWSIAFWGARRMLIRALVARWHSILVLATSELTT